MVSLASPGVLQLRVLDVGQGDAIAVGTPGGRWILVDTGAGSGERLARRLVAQGIPGLALLVLTHPDLDHVGGAADLLRTIPVRAVADGGTVRGTDTYREILAVTDSLGLPWRILRRGTSWTQDGVELSVLHPAGGEDPSDPNGASVVILVRWGAFEALLTGDAPVEAEMAILPMVPPVELLKVGHHGSRTSTGVELLERARPALSVISVGSGNRFGHPAPEVLARLRREGVEVLRTDLHGTLSIRARRDGTFEVEAERGRSD